MGKVLKIKNPESISEWFKLAATLKRTLGLEGKIANIYMKGRYIYFEWST